MIVKIAGALVVPAVTFITVTSAVPSVVSLTAGMMAVSLVAELNVVATAAPFQRTLEFATKLPPFTCSVSSGAPATALDGLSEDIVGLTWKAWARVSRSMRSGPGSASGSR